MAKLTETEWRTLDEFRRDYPAFCDADPVAPDFAERMETAGYLFLRAVEPSDLDQSFAYELGIEPGGSVWDLTTAGRAALKESDHG